MSELSGYWNQVQPDDDPSADHSAGNTFGGRMLRRLPRRVRVKNTIILLKLKNTSARPVTKAIMDPTNGPNR